MLSKKLESALNAQINAEFWSAYLYLSMAAYFAADGKPGFANWFEIQFKEEQDHA
ncbi:MAG: ferritin, partial [Prevotella sp.]|nr:ferritin [Prevotella sp.]